MEKINASPNIISVTPSDTTVYNPPLSGIRVGGIGNVKVRSGGQDVIISSVTAGETLLGNINKVYSTDTTATLITGWQWD